LALLFQLWFSALVITLILIFYLFAVLNAKCWVQTTKGWPCRRNVTGIWTSCEYHPGAKRGFPILLSNGPMSLPVFMWRNPSLNNVQLQAVGSHITELREEVPETAAQISKANTLNTAMAWLTAAGVAIALASFIYDVTAG
jgi:hypothetical protein